MPNSCAAYGCNNRFGTDSQQKKITFHQLPPPNDPRRKLWIANSRRIDPVTRKPWNPSFKYIYFCSDHFMPSDYEICGKTMGRRLKMNAVPTVFIFPSVVPPDPYEQGSGEHGDSDVPHSDERGRHFPRPGKPRNRKVVMLPKKIKLLQDVSDSEMESVTIISFQHLEYNEKLQPIFEEAMIDLQYPEEAEEYYDDDDYYEGEGDQNPEEEFAESNDSLPVKQQDTAQSENEVSEKQLEEEEDMECSDDASEKPATMESESLDTDEKGNNDLETEETNVTPQVIRSVAQENLESKEQKGIEKDFDVTQNRTKISRTDTVKHSDNVKDAIPKKRVPVVIDNVKDAIPKKRVPVVIKEIGGIHDMEELRIKSFKMAEDNIMLKRQVIYLEKKLREILTQLYEK